MTAEQRATLPTKNLPPLPARPLNFEASLLIGRVLQTACFMWEGRGACAGEPNGLIIPGVPSRTLEH